MGTFRWPPVGTYTWPPVGTFSWPRTLGTDAVTIKATSRSVTFVVFFGSDVDTSRCVVVLPHLKNGPEFTDPRVVCAQPPTAVERTLADQRWPEFRKYELNQDKRKKTTSAPTAPPARET